MTSLRKVDILDMCIMTSVVTMLRLVFGMLDNHGMVGSRVWSMEPPGSQQAKGVTGAHDSCMMMQMDLLKS